VYSSNPKGNWFTDAGTVVQSGMESIRYHDLTQSRIDPQYGPRDRISSFVITAPTPTAEGTASANTRFGLGGAHQYYIDSTYQQNLSLGPYWQLNAASWQANQAAGGW